MEPINLQDQTILVTGATGGIGKAICHKLATHGCKRLVIHYNSDKDGAQSLATTLRDKHGADVFVVRADMSNYDEIRKMYNAVKDKFGGPSILINNAGATGGHSGVKTIEDVPMEDFEKTWRINCGSSYLLTQLCMPKMESLGFGRVIFIGSVAGFTGGVVGPHYASSKSALHGLIHWAAKAYAKKGITVNGIAPALIEQTKMLPGSTEELSRKIPLGRLGTPEEVAETVLWMVRTSYVTSKIIGVDGGMFPH